MNYYIADCHFSHKNILHFDQRPFQNVEQMEETAILKSNLKVLAFVHPFVNHFSTPHKAKILYGQLIPIEVKEIIFIYEVQPYRNVAINRIDFFFVTLFLSAFRS